MKHSGEDKVKSVIGCTLMRENLDVDALIRIGFGKESVDKKVMPIGMLAIRSEYLLLWLDVPLRKQCSFLCDVGVAITEASLHNLYTHTEG